MRKHRQAPKQGGGKSFDRQTHGATGGRLFAAPGPCTTTDDPPTFRARATPIAAGGHQPPGSGAFLGRAARYNARRPPTIPSATPPRHPGTGHSAHTTHTAQGNARQDPYNIPERGQSSREEATTSPKAPSGVQRGPPHPGDWPPGHTTRPGRPRNRPSPTPPRRSPSGPSSAPGSRPLSPHLSEADVSGESKCGETEPAGPGEGPAGSAKEQELTRPAGRCPPPGPPTARTRTGRRTPGPSVRPRSAAGPATPRRSSAR
ncbi:hypothetical protein GA0070621_2259 [Micromonospora narathiwatensis]|uniref:Uncharacterized protein n=1 Tax=Micromonospora narathiwatensis TaxID=299146 RepID=A0A1A8ZMM9_9ACTN|nr:hypothetical protein GA0070621_2259 [Micromonospora narathiwatensis]